MKIGRVVSILGLSLAIYSTVQAEETGAGRYQIVEAEHSVSFDGKNFMRKDILRLDTWTGKAWIYHDAMHANDEGKSLTYYHGWELVPEDLKPEYITQTAPPSNP